MAKYEITAECFNAALATQNRVRAIKAVRTITLLGLKEAKDIVDSMISGSSATFKEADPSAMSHGYRLDDAMYELRMSGFLVNAVATDRWVSTQARTSEEVVEVSTTKDKLVRLTKDLVDNGEFDVAMEVLSILSNRFE